MGAAAAAVQGAAASDRAGWRHTLARAVNLVNAVTAFSFAFATFRHGMLYSWHPFGMALGYLFFMPAGILSAAVSRGSKQRASGLEGHVVNAIRAGLLVALGAAAIVYNKTLHNKRHFVSLHAQLGLVALLLTFALPLGGALIFKPLGLVDRIPPQWQARIRQGHQLVGTLTWLVALATMQLMLPHGSVFKASVTPLWQGAIALSAFATLAVLYVPAGQRAAAKPKAA